MKSHRTLAGGVTATVLASALAFGSGAGPAGATTPSDPTVSASASVSASATVGPVSSGQQLRKWSKSASKGSSGTGT